ncbi:nitroreductase [Bacillus idriensis]|uniref:Nitroreductase n=2 Tax=Metabacillus idriensis TaxID=324768 RepID=A0A6I2MER7_9BACI|nr:nitroreductase [Metabacillus idriensis]
MSKTRMLASIYYLFSKEFDREHHSVLNGKLTHLNDIKRRTSNHFLLRRNIHRLEKGLLMRPMRKIFAVGYIEETVFCYKSIIDDLNKGKLINFNELKWAYDVLNNYFSVTGSDNKIDRMRELFLSIDHVTNVPNRSKEYIPYNRDLDKKLSVSYEDLLELAKFRRSVRWFSSKEVPRTIIDKAINVATLSPSACNRQPFEFRIFDNPEKLKEASILPMGTQGYSDNIPVMVAVVGKLNAYPYERDRHLIYIDSSLAAMSFVYALETQGLSSCIINWPDIEDREKKVSKFLNLGVDERVIMFIALGYPDPEGKVAFSQKKELDELRTYN